MIQVTVCRERFLGQLPSYQQRPEKKEVGSKSSGGMLHLWGEYNRCLIKGGHLNCRPLGITISRDVVVCTLQPDKRGCYGKVSVKVVLGLRYCGVSFR